MKMHNTDKTTTLLMTENEKLKDTIDDLEHKIDKQAKELNRLLLEQKTSTELQTQLSTWQSVVDELAHSINTDVYIAVNQLSRYRDDPRINKAYHHVNQIRDLTNLLMTYIKRNELVLSGEMKSLDVHECVKGQLALIRDGISTLRLSEDDHIDRLLSLEVPVKVSETPSISVQKEFVEAVPLILKDLLRNAFKNTDEEDPRISVSITESPDAVQIEITNNRAIAESFRDWFNGVTHIDPAEMSKSGKVGLRVIKMWVDLLHISATLTPNYTLNTTTAVVVLPKRIIL